MQQPQRTHPRLRTLPNPVSRGDRPRRWVASLLPSQPRPRHLGLFLAPLLPTPLGPMLSGEKGPWPSVCPGSVVQGRQGNGLPLWLLAALGGFLEGGAMWSSDKTWNSTCWPRYWVFLSGLLGRHDPSWFCEAKRPQNDAEVCGPTQGGNQVRAPRKPVSG